MGRRSKWQFLQSKFKNFALRPARALWIVKKHSTKQAVTLDGALEALRKSGLAASAKKAGRIASEGLVGSYIHGGGKIGVLVEINCETDFVGRNEDFQGFVRDVAMHVAAANPQYLNREEVPAEIVEKEKKSLQLKSLTKASQLTLLKKSLKAESTSSSRKSA